MTYCTPKDTWRIQNPVIFRYLSVSKLDSHHTFSTPWAWSKAGDLKETQSSLKQSQADCGNPYENEKSWIDYIDKYIYIYYIDNLDVYNYDW